MVLIFDALIWFQRIGQFFGQLWFYDRFHSRVFQKRHFEKNKMFTPARNWGVPRKFISRRKCWSHKSRGLAKWLKVWQNLQLGNLGYPRPRHIKVHILRMSQRAMLSSLLLKFEGLKPAHRFLNPATVMITFCRKSSLWTVRIRFFTALICL